MKVSKGIALSAGRSDITGNWYPREVLEKAVANYKAGSLRFGEMGTPDRLNIDVSRVSHRITQIDLVGDDVQVEITTTPTQEGTMLECLIDQGAIFRISPRALGRIDPKTQEVADLQIITFDVVSEASLPIIQEKSNSQTQFEDWLNGSVIGILVVIVGLWVGVNYFGL